jgi:hypothetical protein
LKCIVIPSSIEIFGDECFRNCKHLRSTWKSYSTTRMV